MDSITEMLAPVRDALAQVPTPVYYALTGVGALFVLVKVLSYLSLVLNVFILGGTNVSSPPT